MAKKIIELNDPTIPLNGSELMEMSQSDTSIKVTVDQLLSEFSKLGTDNVRLTYDGTSVLQISVERLTDIEYTDFKTDGVVPSWNRGRVFWDDSSNTLGLYNDVSDVTLQVGQEMHVRVRNLTGSDILSGQIVYINGSSGQTPTVDLSQAIAQEKIIKRIGVATHSIDNNNNGYITLLGMVRNINTSTFAEGAGLWVSESIPGGLRDSPPPSPYYKGFVGTVIISGVNGSILVYPSVFGDLNLLADVNVTGTVEGSILTWDSTSGLWLTSYTVDEFIGGVEDISSDSTSVAVVFVVAQVDEDYHPVCTLENITDPSPSFYQYMVTSKTVDGFVVAFDNLIDSANYKLNWKLSR